MSRFMDLRETNHRIGIWAGRHPVLYGIVLVLFLTALQLGLSLTSFWSAHSSTPVFTLMLATVVAAGTRRRYLQENERPLR